MKKWQIILEIALAAALGIGVGAYAATNYGSQSDPLITLSYLNDTLAPSMTKQFDGQLETAMEELENRFAADVASATGGFVEVSVASGGTLKGSAGTEILFVSGSGAAVGSILDMTSGAQLSSGGALTANHLYICRGASEGFKASAAASVMVRGAHSVS